MNPKAVLAELTLIDNAIADADQHVKRQQRYVAKLEREGHDIGQAMALLATHRRLRDANIGYRNFLLKRLRLMSMRSKPA